MSESLEDDLLLPDQASSPVPKLKLRRLKKGSQSDPRDIPTADPNPSPSADEVLEFEVLKPTAPQALEESLPQSVNSVIGSDEIGTEKGQDLEELDPLFPDLARQDLKDADIGREEEGFDWGGESGSAGVEETNDEFVNVKSAKKRLNLEQEGETTKKSKKNKSGEKTKESVRDKKRLEKERKAQLVQIHSETQRLLRETRDAAFKPVSLVQKPISSVLEKIRLRKLEMLKRCNNFNHSESINETVNCEADNSHDVNLIVPENGKEDVNSKENNLLHSEESLDAGEVESIPNLCKNQLHNEASNPNSEDAVQTQCIENEDISNDSQETGGSSQLMFNINDTSHNSSLMLSNSRSKLVSMDVGGPSSSSSQEDDTEKVDLRPPKVVNMNSYSEGGHLKAFFDDEAEEEDDSDHDMMRFQENEEDDSDDHEEINDLIASGFEEAPIDYERRNQLHQKWLEQQDATATDNFLQRLRCHQKLKEPSFSHEEEENEEFSEDSGEEESVDILPTNIARQNRKMAKQMSAKMYTDDHDTYLPSDDEETEQALIRQRLQKQNDESTFASVTDDAHSKEVFGLIKKMNVAPESKKQYVLSSSVVIIQSFLGRATSSIHSSHKQGSTVVRAYIFGRDDSNSRSSISAPENLQDLDQIENRHKKPSAKYSGSQMKSSATTKTDAQANSGSSLFQILRQSSACFDKQMDTRMKSSENTTETEAAHQFSAFKLGRSLFGATKKQPFDLSSPSWVSTLEGRISRGGRKEGEGRRLSRIDQMESSEEEDDFPTHEWITPQSSINSIYQSHTEKGIRKVCSELLELKDAVENLSGNMQSKYLAFLRLSEEVIEMEQELIDLQKHVSAQGILVQDLMSGVCRELEVWNKYSSEEPDPEEELSEINQLLHNDMEDPKITFLETIDVLLAEHKLEEALLTITTEEKNSPELCDSGNSSVEGSSYRLAFLKKKELLVDKVVEIAEQPYICIAELRKATSNLVKLGKGSLALKLILNAYDSRLQKNIEAFIPSCSVYTETYTAILSQLVFSTISVAAKESTLIVGDMANYMNRIVQWAEDEIESFVRLVKENSPSAETAIALRSTCVCVQASLSHCSLLESQGLKFSKLIMVLLFPYIEEVLDLNFRRAKRKVTDLTKHDNVALLASQLDLPLSVATPPTILFSGIGKAFMSIVEDILDQLTPMVISHFGGSILNKLLHLFDKFVEILIKALPGPSEDDNLIEPKESEGFRAETDAEQLGLLGTAYTVALELLPMSVSKIVTLHNENKEVGGGTSESRSAVAVSTLGYKDWRRNLQHSLDKLRDHFCRQYVLTFIYSREGKARLDARIYLDGKGDDLFWDSEPLPSLPFRGLFGRLQQLTSVAGDVLLGKEKIQKVLLSRLTETVVMWLSEEHEFWDVFEDESVQLQPLGLQQLILDMHFIVEIAVCGGYSSRNVNQLVSAVITRAIGTFSTRGIDPQSALPEDEWFVDTAKTAINKLMGTSESEMSEADEHIAILDEISDSDESLSSPSIIESVDSFASANMGETDSPVYFTDPDT
ncbi:exocyst complex component EXO84C isoform X1 [Canna indica]|uniref:Exocyst complex component EXO84C isoform X1 n=1 Tax=Canna indica TaxID=4628 RepID=A0AAQ3QQX2_9LILI|nr:exocyst complex component EXO84C isoform X1 [Canna indica]